MAGSWIADPTAEATGTQLDISDGTVYKVHGQDFPAPEPKPSWATPVDSDGERVSANRYGNRTVTLSLTVLGASAAAIQTAATALASKCAKFTRDAVVNGTGVGGTLQYTTPAGSVIVFDVCSARYSAATGDAALYGRSKGLPVTLVFECLPFARGALVTLGDHAETTLPYLAFTETTITGDVPALGRLVVDEDTGQAQNWLAWGLRSKTYSSATSADVYYAATGRTPLGGGAAISGSYILANNLGNSLQAILSTQQVASPFAHLTHVGRYHAYASVKQGSGNTGTVTAALEWAVGDFRAPTRNATKTLATGNRNADEITDLGVVDIPTGTTQWEGRVLAASTVTGDDLYVKWILLVPCSEGFATAQSITQRAASTGYVGYDDFSTGTYAGGLPSDTAPTGGTWGAAASAYTGTTNDFAVSGGVAARTAVSDTSTDVRYGRWLYLSGTTGMTNQSAQVTVSTFSTLTRQGVVLRVVDKDNFAVCYYDPTYSGAPYGSDTRYMVFAKVVAGTVTTLLAERAYLSGSGTLQGTVDAGGTFTIGYRSDMDASSSITVIATGQDSALATGGALASGYAGIFDWHTSATAETRSYGAFYAWAPVSDAVAFASQSVAVRDDSCIRENSGGTFWSPVSRYEGDRLFIPPSGAEGRTLQVVVKMSRGIPGSGADPAADDLSAVLSYVPRWLQIPA